MASVYPGTLDTFTTKQDGEQFIIYAAHVNDLQNAVLAVETELGTDPAGSLVNLKTRLAVLLTDAGAFKGPQQVKIVAKANGQYTTIQSAIDAIGDATAAKPYVVRIFPGIYDETVTMKDHVHLVGHDPRSCRIDTTSSYAVRVTSNITTSVSNLYLRTTGEEGESLRITNGTVYLHNCVVESDVDSYTAYIGVGILHARNCQFHGHYSVTLNIRTNSTFRRCTITSTVDNAVYVSHASPELLYCDIEAGGNEEAIDLGETDSNIKLGWCKLLKSGSATESVHAVNANTAAQIYLCAMNAALDADIDNDIGTPYNVIDADLT